MCKPLRIARPTLFFVLLAEIAIAQDLAAPRTQGSSFFALLVSDVVAAQAWYEQQFGLEQVKEAAVEGRFAIRILANEHLTVELIERTGATKPDGPHHGHFKAGLFVDDLDAAFAWFQSRDIGMDERIVVDETLSVRTFVLRDLEGNRIQLFERCAGNC